MSRGHDSILNLTLSQDPISLLGDFLDAKYTENGPKIMTICAELSFF